MKLELLPHCSIIRLFNFTSGEVQRLHAAIQSIGVPSIKVHELPFIESIGNCQLVFAVGTRDESISLFPGTDWFICQWTLGTWEDVLGRMEPFTRGANGYQWLATMPSEVQLLLSQSGDW